MENNNSNLLEYRCKYCNRLFFKGKIQYATIEIKCKNCKRLSLIHGSSCNLWLFMDNQGIYKRSSESASKKSDGSALDLIKDSIIKCEQCKNNSNYENFQFLKNYHLCPLCHKKID